MTNRRIRKAMFDADLKQYDLAELLGCSESKVSAMLRKELPEAETRRIVAAIKSLSEIKSAEDKK